MVVVRQWGTDHVNNSFRQIDAATWLIGGRLLCRSPKAVDTATWIDKEDLSSYTLMEAPLPFPATTALQTSHITLVHEAGDASAVWAIGSQVLCKVKYVEEGVTPEAATLKFVQSQHPSFETPQTVYHWFMDGRSYLFLKRIPGRTLDQAWPSLSKEWRYHYVNVVVNICKEMAEWEGNCLCGVDNQNIPEYYLQPKDSKDFTALQDTCNAIGMDCSTFAFYHADLGPSNIIVEERPMTGKVGIIDFEISGYFPRGWIRTKFRLSSGMNLSSAVTDDPTWWRSEVQKALGANGFNDHAEAWMNWMNRLN